MRETATIAAALGRARIMPTSRMLSRSAAATTTGKCPYCGVEIRPRQTPKGAWYITTFCSRSCGAKARWPEIPDQACEHCGRIFKRPPSGLPRRFCSRPCSDQGARNPQGWIRKRHGYPVFWTGKTEVLMHRIVMERTLGRELRCTETVHHVNGDKGDWRPENLELWDHAQPHGQRVPDKIAWCIAYLTDHGYAVSSPPAADRG